MTYPPMTSFIIPHKGRTELLLKTLASIQAQTRFDWIDSIVIVTMNREPILFKNNDKITCLTIPDAPSISYQRNFGAAKTTSPYLAFLDADIELAPDWLETCHALLAERPERLMVSAMQRCKNNSNTIERVRTALSNVALNTTVSFLPGRNLLLNRSSFTRAGGFPEHLKTCEDYFFTERVSENGELFYTSNTWYYHLGEDTSYGEIFAKERWRSEYNLLSISGRAIPIQEWPSLLLPFWFILVIFLSIVSLVAADRDLASINIIAWFIPIFAYSLRLYVKNTDSLPFWEIFKFYSAYFPGRALGTSLGIKSLLTAHLNQAANNPSNFEPCETSPASSNSRPVRVMQFICPTGYYGAERWIIALANNLNREQIHCELVVTRETAEPLEVCQKFSALGLPCHEIELRNRFDLKAITTLTTLLKQQQIDVLHTHGYKSDILGIIAAKRAGIPAICTPHGFENAKDWKLRTYLWLGGLSFRYFDVISPLSPQIESDLRQHYHVPSDKIKPILNGVDLSEVCQIRDHKTQHDQETQQKHDRFIIGYIGQLISRKNLRDLLTAFSHFSKTHSNVELHLIGDGEERPQLEQLAHKLGIVEKTRFLGFRDDRLTLLKNIDVFGMTSSLEGIPRCLMEAMAMGVPLTAFHIPGVDQLIENRKTGLSCPFGDTHALADCWEKLYQSPELRATLIKNAQHKVKNTFSAERMAHEYATLFQHTLTGKYLQFRKPTNTSMPTPPIESTPDDKIPKNTLPQNNNNFSDETTVLPNTDNASVDSKTTLPLKKWSKNPSDSRRGI